MLISILVATALAGRAQATQPTPTTPPGQISLPVILPKGTPIKLMLAGPLSSQQSPVGGRVMYCVAEDVKDAANPPHILVPAGSFAVGKLTAKRGSFNLTHAVGMLAFSADTIGLSDKDYTTIDIHIKETDKAHGDFRTSHSLVPPNPTKAELANVQATQQSSIDTLLGAIGSKQRSSALVANPLSQNSLVMLSKVVKFKDSDQLVGQLQNIETLRNNPLSQLVGTFKSAKSILNFGKVFGIASSLTLIGAGLGLIEIIDYIKGIFRHVTVANGTIFDAYTTEDTTVPVATSMVSRGGWSSIVRVLKPSLFAHSQLFVPVQDRNGKITLQQANAYASYGAAKHVVSRKR